MAIFTDVIGATFGLWQPNQHRGFEVYGEPGAPCWFELQTRELFVAEAFYTQVFNIGSTITDTGADGPAYRTLDVEDEARAGIVDVSGTMLEDTPPFWMVYFGVRDIEEALRSVEAKGGRVITDPMDSPQGRWATLTDPLDAPFGIMEVRHRLGVG